LDELPFIRLRPIIGPLLIGDGKSSLVNMVKVAQAQIEELTKSPEVIVDLAERSLMINDQKINLPVKNLAVYCAFMKLRLDDAGDGKNGFLTSFDIVNEYGDRSFLKFFLTYYVMMYGEKKIFAINEVEKFKNEDYDDPWFRQTKSKINKALKDNISYPEYEFSKISRVGSSNDSRHGLLIDKDMIIINQR